MSFKYSKFLFILIPSHKNNILTLKNPKSLLYILGAPPFLFYEGMDATVLCRRRGSLTILNSSTYFEKIIISKVLKMILKEANPL